MKTVGDILTPKQLKEVTKIINSIPNTNLRVAALKKYFKSIRRQLAKHKTLPDYLAYLVEAAAQHETAKAMKNN